MQGFCYTVVTMIDWNYRKSNKTLTVKIKVTNEARRYCRRLLEAKDARERQRISEDLLDELCDAAKIDIVEVKVSDINQKHSRKGGKIVMRQYGFYDPNKKEIHITNRTAARGQILAPKSFIDTVLHEWVHHYDCCKLKLNSVHTKGFYSRLKDIKQKLGYFDF